MAQVSRPPDANGGAASGPPALSSSFWVGSRLGKYLLTDKLGSGGMGVLYEAQDPFLKRTVAIKLLAESVAAQPEALNRFLHEARAAARLNHPNIVAVHEVDQQSGTYYMVMELLRGGSAQEFLDAQGPFDWPEATRVLTEVCRGVEAAHAAGLIHRDIRPAHIMRDSGGAVKLTDFGLAKVCGPTPLGPPSHAGSIVGMPEFISPEQCRADPLDERTDIYALGATYFALLTGRPPYGGNPMQVMFAHCSAEVPDPRSVNPQLPRDCTAIISKAMAKAPAARYPSATALLAALDVVLATAPPAALSAGRWTGALADEPALATPPPDPDASDEALALLGPPQQADELGRLGPYRVLRVLGEGGMGVVFQAEDPALERPVALKVMKPDRGSADVSRQRFLQEAKAAASLQHEHVVTIYQVGEDRDVPYLAMQFLRGEPLDKRLRRAGQLPVAEVLRIGREIAAGLAAAHNRSLIHRDIKPANIWLEDTGDSRPPRVKILDFGLARSARQDAQNLTRTGMVMGTPGYMAPEQARGGGQLDFRCDLFSLGCVLYHMTTGQEPFRREDTMATLMALALEEPPPVRRFNPAAPSGLVRIITALLMKRPVDRPNSASAVIELLEEVEREVAVAPPALALAGGAGSSGTAEEPARLAELGLSPADDSTELKAATSLGPSASAAAVDTPSGGHPQTAALEPAAETEKKLAPGTSGCPRCGAPGLNPASRAWCLACGYYPEPEKSEVKPAGGTRLDWLWILLTGMIFIVVVSFAARTYLPLDSYARTRWSVTELAIGIVAVIVGHVWAFVVTLPERDDHKIFNYIDFSLLWRYTLQELPKTRRPLWIGCWGGVGILCAVFLVGGVPYLWQGLPKRLAARAGSASGSASDFAPPAEASTVAEPELTGADKDLPKQEKRFSERCTIVGYLRDEEGTITGLVIATQRDGALRFAGVVKSQREQEPTKDEMDAASKLMSARLVSVEPAVEGLDERRVKLAALDPTAQVRWVKPEMGCEIEYTEADTDGMLRDPILKGW